MFHVALGGLDEIGDEVVAALELHVDLRVGVFETVAQGDEGVVDAGDPEAEDDHDDEQNAEDYESWDHDDANGVRPPILCGVPSGARRNLLQRG